jgi:pimeloyl-ACP methyl ester carboxylesterase
MKPHPPAHVRILRALKLHVLLLATLCGLSACDDSQPTLVIVVGGLGSTQLDDLRNAIAHQCPDATVVSTGNWDGYKADLNPLIAQNPHQRLILVGHSLGCQTIAKAADHLPAVDLTVFIDPCWDDFQLPKNVDRYLWYRRSDFGLERKARILGAAAPKTIAGGHNSIPHSSVLIDEVVAAVKDTSTGQRVMASAN